jgi:hypothetical protein
MYVLRSCATIADMYILSISIKVLSSWSGIRGYTYVHVRVTTIKTSIAIG